MRLTSCRMPSSLRVALAALALAISPVLGRGQAIPLPPSQAGAQVLSGAHLYQRNCALCHGVAGRDATVFPRPIWGPGNDIAKFGSAKGLFEYLQLLMPFDDPSKMDDIQKTAVVAYILVRNGNLSPDTTLPVGGDPTPIR